MTLKIDWVFEEEKNIESKNGQNGHELSNQNGPQPMQNVLHEGKSNFFCKIISLYTIKKPLCGN